MFFFPSSSDFCNENENITFTIEMDKFNQRCLLNRTEWRFVGTREKDSFINDKYSVVTEYDLVCNDKASAIATLFFVGCTIGQYFQ